jgi:hypothetical protein
MVEWCSYYNDEKVLLMQEHKILTERELTGPGGLYHHHFNGDFTSDDDAKLIGWLRDGFLFMVERQRWNLSFYSRFQWSTYYATTEYPNGIYHYH